jgi:hypothetical protein
MGGKFRICNHANGRPVPRVARFIGHAEEAERSFALGNKSTPKLNYAVRADSRGQLPAGF